MPNTPHAQIGKYEIESLVGEGAMGNVYRALDPLLNRTVAVKVMSDAIARDAELRDRFMREARAAGSLQHPNVVTIFDFGEFEGHLYIAMEFVAGVDLEIMIAERRAMPLSDQLGLIVDVLMGLGYAHKHGVVHRDIKPANIRVSEDGRAKIMDFGIAHLDSARMTKTGMMMGTPNYMAPEQVTAGPITPATDLFSVGAVLYELVSGKKAFTADTLHGVLFQVVSGEPTPLAQLVPDLPMELQSLVTKALTKDPALRYQNALEMAHEIDQLRARLSGTPQRPVSLSLSATMAHQLRQAQPAPAPAQPARPRVPAGRVAAGVGVLALTLWATRDLWRGGTAPTADNTAATSPAAAPPDPATAGGAAFADSGQAQMVQIVRASALGERDRALRMRAPQAEIARGDARLAVADSLFRDRRYARAVQTLNAATLIWRDAERMVAASSGAPVEPRGAGGSSLPTVSAAPPTLQAETPAVREPEPASRREPEPGAGRSTDPVVRREPDPLPDPPPVVRAPEAVAAPSTAASEAQLARLIGDYAQAIGSRDIARIREVYPALTTEQAQRFTQFFNAVRSVKANLASGTPTITGSSASARVAGSYEFVDQSGKTQRQPVSFVASFTREADQWRLASVR